MSIDKTPALLLQIEAAGSTLAARAYALDVYYADAMYEYNRLGCEDDFLTGPEDDAEHLARDFEDGINAADAYLKKVTEDLADVDRLLLRLIHLRGKLAEEIGIPLGGKEWVRLETYDM